jgi:hypothetical protein
MGRWQGPALGPGCDRLWSQSRIAGVERRGGLTLLAAMWMCPATFAVLRFSRAEGHPRHLILDGKSA